MAEEQNQSSKQPNRDEPTRRESTGSILDSMLPTSESGSFDLTMSLSDGSRRPSSETPMPDKIGRYSIKSLLGEGTFGRVFRAFDEQLHRDVAIKVPHAHHVSSDVCRERYLEEARTLAKVDHANVVVVHDVGLTDSDVPYIVSDFVEGSDLEKRMQDNPLSLREAIKLLIDIGRALDDVHTRGIVHRDVKPGNILLNEKGKPFLADFGLALRDQPVEPMRSRVGTLAYMSPEQARGESHLVDGRSDIFSLGVILYEMLAGKRPFSGRDRASVVYSLLHQEARPVRQLQKAVPRELERICLKALAKRVSQRYNTAIDFVEDLEHFLAETESTIGATPIQHSEEEPAKSDLVGGVIPRGLRSYDRHDKKFFCRLLPGPRDREGIPESLRFWQRQFENSDASDPPRVGVLYGPSGCGKSSFVKAGLLPLLDDSLVSVFVEATREDTETRIMRGVRKKFPNVKAKTLSAMLAEIRSEPSIANSRRLLIVVDQFEQWLHGRHDEADPDLATALRQCDGHNVQCLLLVRDDFWLSLSRFMAIVEVPLKQNHNAAMVDLFHARHARRVLAEFGVAYDRLPMDTADFTVDQNLFLDRALEELSEGGKVFPVRLSLFVEMVKAQPWEISTLNRLGGVEGIGIQFLEESFSSSYAPAAQRTHEQAVRKVLTRLLPEQGVHIKGNMQSESVLLESSGLSEQPAAFDEMMRVLVSDLRLVMPTDPAGSGTTDESLSKSGALSEESVSGEGVCYYQLTHDFLVPAIEQWLSQKQRETRRGRAELRLAEYASVWSAKPVPRNAPSWLDWLSIKMLTPSTKWSSSESAMMAVATRKHVTRSVLAIGLVTLLVAGAWYFRSVSGASASVAQLQTARAEQMDEVLNRVAKHGSFSVKPLESYLKDAPRGSHAELANRLALSEHDDQHRQVLIERSAEPDLAMSMLMVLRQHLQPLDAGAEAFYKEILLDDSLSGERRLRAAMMLSFDSSSADSDSDQSAETSDSPSDSDSFWTGHGTVIVDAMISHAKVAPQDNSHMIEALSPITPLISPALSESALQPNESPERSLSTSFLLQFLDERPEQLLDFFLDASFEQQDNVIESIGGQLENVADQVRKIAFTEIQSGLEEHEHDQLAKRKGTAAALLHRFGSEEATWPLLRLTKWPHTRSWFLLRVGPLGGDFSIVLNRFSREPQVSIRRALLWMLSEFDWDSLSEASQLEALTLARDAFENDPDVGIHSSAEHLLVKWQDTPWLKEKIEAQSKLPPDPRKNWFVNGEGQTMAVFDARDVAGIGRVFAISTKEVTVGQFLRYSPEHDYYDYRSQTPDAPIGLMNWYHCLGYCRWLSKELDADVEHIYPPEIKPDDQPGAKPDAAYDFVERDGAYRLPTAAEWEYACAATTTSLRYYGMSNEIGNDFYDSFYTSVHPTTRELRYYPAGRNKPNDFGMFSMYDNVREWGNDPIGKRRTVYGSHSGMEVETAKTFQEPVSSDLPLATNGMYGLRVAKTIVETDR